MGKKGSMVLSELNLNGTVYKLEFVQVQPAFGKRSKALTTLETRV